MGVNGELGVVVPEGWKIKTIWELGSVSTGKTPHKDNFKENGYQFITPEEIHRIRDSYSSEHHKCELLFRGQANQKWALETTVERVYSNNMLYIKSYLSTVLKIKPEIESITGVKWETVKDAQTTATDLFNDISLVLPHLEYLIYLRHHSFPSPLLDWTRSEHIATFFAFHEKAPQAERVAIYLYINSTDEARSCDRGEVPQITLHNEPVRSHRRHFVQKACYTTASRRIKDDHIFVPHESICNGKRTDQDLLFKFTIPANERSSILRRLDNYNINPYTLYQTEDSLISSLALREELSCTK